MSKIPDTNNYIHMLEVCHPLREPVLRSAIEVLQLPPGSRGLDVGCGIGLPALLLVETVGQDGHVTGLDRSPEFLNYARSLAEHTKLDRRIAFQKGDLNHLPFEDEIFDWVWSADCAGYAVEDPLPLFEELTRVIKPGGVLVLLFWSSQMLLPGYPVLEARLNATSAGIAPFKTGMRPETHYWRTLRWMHAVGMQDTLARTFIGTIQAPLREEMRYALLALFQMRWGQAEAEVSQKDWAEYQRICQPESPEFILDLPEYYAFFTYSMFYGTVGEKR